MFSIEEVTLLLTALKFSAEKHRFQRRKDQEVSPYINHPIQVAELLWQQGKIRDIVTIVGALLHDTLEDTNATPEEIHELFGAEVLALVQEVTDDKSLPKSQRKRLQIELASHKSIRAKQVKLADKICNVYDITHSPPQAWSLKRRQEYLEWSEQVVAGLRGINPALESHYDIILAEAKQTLTLQQQTLSGNDRKQVTTIT
jgi:guanosine-3',5'-bis(diphosphate) 3'-pyrophosphohydrolase